MNDRFKNILEKIKSLPVLPSIVIETSKLLEDPSASFHDLSRIISRDQGLTTKILSVANSPLFGMQRKVSNIDFAVVVLGIENIKNIVFGLSILEAVRNQDSRYWNRKKYYDHSFIVANLCKRIADEVGYPKTSEAFTSGLLHDMGIAVIRHYLEKDFNRICEKIETEYADYMTEEEKVFGFTHQDVAFYLAEKWKLPATIGQAILNHHAPSKSKEKTLSSIIHLADYMTKRFNAAGLVFDNQFELDKEVIKTLRMKDEEELESFIDGFEGLITQQMETV